MVFVVYIFVFDTFNHTLSIIPLYSLNKNSFLSVYNIFCCSLFLSEKHAILGGVVGPAKKKVIGTKEDMTWIEMFDGLFSNIFGEDYLNYSWDRAKRQMIISPSSFPMYEYDHALWKKSYHVPGSDSSVPCSVSRIVSSSSESPVLTTLPPTSESASVTSRPVSGTSSLSCDTSKLPCSSLPVSNIATITYAADFK